MNYPVLQSLAYLKINAEAEKGKIFLDNFVPFVIESLKEHKEVKINLQALQGIVKRKFGIAIPQNVIKAILHRSRKAGYVTFQNGLHHKVDNKIQDYAFASMQSRVVRIYSALLVSLIEFAKEKYQVDISESEAENLLLSFISYYQADFYETDEKAYKRLTEEAVKLDRSKRYIVASYILNAKDQDPQIYEYIDVVVKGYMISQVLYLPNAHETNKRFSKTKVFLDTSFIIYALGYSGIEFKNSSTELLELLYRNSASLYCFEHTVEEIEGILLACSAKLGNYSDGAFGRTLRYFESIGDTPFDIRLKISHLRRNIHNLNIKIVNIPEYSDDRFVAGEVELFELLKQRMSHSKEEAVKKDVASISAIYRFRKNDLTSFIENTSALFVTTTPTIAATSNEYFYKYNDLDQAPPCVTDYYLTNILWLKSPNHAPDLPMKRIIADAYAAVQPSDTLMEKWLIEVEKLKKGEPVSEEDYYFMRSSEEVYNELMQHTLGDARAVTADKVRHIVQDAKNKIRLQVEDKFLPELRSNKNSIFELKKRLNNEELTRNRKKENRENLSRKIAKALITGLSVLLFFVLLLGVALGMANLLTSLGLSPIIETHLPGYLTIGSLIVLALLTVITRSYLKNGRLRLKPKLGASQWILQMNNGQL